MSDEKRTTEPHDRLTRICDAMTDTLEAHPEYRNDKCIVFLDGDEMSGLVMHGYEDDIEAAVHLFMHLRAIFKVNGKDLQIHAMGQG